MSQKQEIPNTKKLITTAFLETIGEAPDREGLLDTPARVARSWDELFAGYAQAPEDILSTSFVEGACNEMVILRDITGFSTCEHHVLPFSYRAHIGYIPAGKVVGVSKLARLVECFARRLQIQERMTTQVADTMVKVLHPKGVMVVVEGQHLCMAARGVKQHESVMVTSAIRGVFEQPETRSEFLRLIGK